MLTQGKYFVIYVDESFRSHWLAYPPVRAAKKASNFRCFPDGTRPADLAPWPRCVGVGVSLADRPQRGARPLPSAERPLTWGGLRCPPYRQTRRRVACFATLGSAAATEHRRT